jgi:hypothetical protein
MASRLGPVEVDIVAEPYLKGFALYIVLVDPAER